jgi:ABC-2 type transport system ATP-binding protein
VGERPPSDLDPEDLLEGPPPERRPAPLWLPRGDLSVRVEGLVKRYGRTEALRGLTFTAEGPLVFGIVGPDGAGKTTLMRILAGLIDHDGGKVSVLGFEPSGEAQALKPLLGYVPQTFSMYPTLTVEENLAFVARCHRIPSREFEKRRTALLRLARLVKFAGARAETLSGGMKQKLALCGALLPHPPLVILDEPTTGVDVVARAEFWDTIREEAKRALILVSTNYLDEAERCDQILYMVKGRAVAIGSPREIRQAAPVRVFRVSVPGAQEYEVATALRRESSFDRIEATPRGVRLETRLTEESVADRIAALKLVSRGAARIEELEPDLETALLTLERRARDDGPRGGA